MVSGSLNLEIKGMRENKNEILREPEQLRAVGIKIITLSKKSFKIHSL